MGHVLADALTLWETGDLVKLLSFFAGLWNFYGARARRRQQFGGDGRLRDVVKNLLRGD